MLCLWDAVIGRGVVPGDTSKVVMAKVVLRRVLLTSVPVLILMIRVL